MIVPEIGDIFGISENSLDSILKNSTYKVHTFRKSGGGVRVIYEPDKGLKEIQNKFHNRVLVKIPIALGINGIRDTDIIDHIRPHLSQSIILTTDIGDYFPSIGRRYILETLEKQKILNSEWRELASYLVTFQEKLPQGAPTSTYIASLVI
jgi:hypothetical protein